MMGGVEALAGLFSGARVLFLFVCGVCDFSCHNSNALYRLFNCGFQV